MNTVNSGTALIRAGTMPGSARQAHPCQRIARQRPNVARAWFNYGFALCEGGRPREAVAVFTRVLNMGYRPATAMYNIGCSYALAGDRQAAISWLMKAADAGFDVGGYAKADRDLESVRDEPWVAERIAEARRRHGKQERRRFRGRVAASGFRGGKSAVQRTRRNNGSRDRCGIDSRRSR